MSERSANIADGLRLFALSFTALFLELMLIRWVPAVVKLVAYYANLMLISSFLGLGLGAMLAGRRWKWFGWFPLLLLIDVTALWACQWATVPGSTLEFKFYEAPSRWHALAYLVLIAVFVLNTLLFVPLGQRIGELFRAMPPLRAYSWDLCGSLAGTLTFGAFSLYHFSPLIGLIGVMLVYLALAADRQRLIALPLFGVVLAGVFFTTQPNASWSPYHYITLSNVVSGAPVTGDPPPDLRTMKDPPVYNVSVGRDFYQMHGTIAAERYSPGSPLAQKVKEWRDQYLVPFQLAPRRERVVVMGAGGGMDVEAALIAGASHVDAVEIDPSLVALSRKYNASGVYGDPRVKIYVDDARAYVRRMPAGYDLIVFGYLDSQALFSTMANVRLDGYIYTIQSMRTAFEKLAPDGVLSLSFYAAADWIVPKLANMLREATGKEPVCYASGGAHVFCVAKSAVAAQPAQYETFARLELPRQTIDLPTDDWPYLYLMRRTVPGDYAIVIGALLLFSVLAVGSARGWQIGAGDAHFFFLGLGFLLLQTKSITDCSLYFGTTWVVTTIVIAGVLLMVLAANLVTMNQRGRGPSAWLYAPLFASLLVVQFAPRDLILSLPFAARLALALLIVPLPIFFAGLIFSTTFREAADPSLALGANLIGATVGGFCEYLGMAVGMWALGFVVMGAYALGFVCRRASFHRFHAR